MDRDKASLVKGRADSCLADSAEQPSVGYCKDRSFKESRPMVQLRSISLSSVLLLAILSTAETQTHAGEVRQKFLASGVTARIGGYRPIRAEMTEETDGVKVAPEGLVAPLYGTLEFGEKKFGFIVDVTEDGTSGIYVDSNADGDYTNDPECEWSPRKSGEYTTWSGGSVVDLGLDDPGAVNFYRFDPADPRREVLKKTLLFYSDFGTEFEFELDGKTHTTFSAGDISAIRSLPVNRDDNPRISRNFETVIPGEPFNFTGTTYVLKIAENKLLLEKADTELPVKDLPPDLRIGKPTLTFTARTMEGHEVNFPGDYAGRIVMLDCWATWCGPCIGEIPHMKEAYTAWHEKGFDILGVSFDSEGADEKVAAFLEKHELPWPQIFEGKGWDTTIGRQHDVSGIPFVLLIDGDTGTILATAAQLRGSGLSEFIGEQLENKHGKPAEASE